MSRALVIHVQDEDGKALKTDAANPSLLAYIILDVSIPAHVENAAKFVAESGKKLVGLVNSAGKYNVGPMEASAPQVEDLIQVL